MTDTPVLVARFTIPGEPVSKARARFTKSGHSYTPEKTKEGEQRVALAFRAKVKGTPRDNEIAYRVEARFYNGTRQRRDVDNMVKLILDGLNGIAWLDDNQVTQIAARKSYVTKAAARTEVSVFEVGRLESPKSPCLRCGTEFRTYASWASNPNGKKYCSRECAYAHRVERRERTCEHCGSSFLAAGQGSETKFCSRQCADDHKRADVECTECGTTFTKQRCHVRKTNYCTPECQTKAMNRRRSTRMRGTCETCGGGVTKAHYRQCQACKRGQGVQGKPRPIEETS